MAKRKDWVYTSANSCLLGTGCSTGYMKCLTCGHKLQKGAEKNEFRYYSTEKGFNIQCRYCCTDTREWDKIEIAHKKRIEEIGRIERMCREFYRKTGVIDLRDYLTDDDFDTIDKEWSL